MKIIPQHGRFRYFTILTTALNINAIWKFFFVRKFEKLFPVWSETNRMKMNCTLKLEQNCVIPYLRQLLLCHATFKHKVWLIFQLFFPSFFCCLLFIIYRIMQQIQLRRNFIPRKGKLLLYCLASYYWALYSLILHNSVIRNFKKNFTFTLYSALYTTVDKIYISWHFVQHLCKVFGVNLWTFSFP